MTVVLEPAVDSLEWVHKVALVAYVMSVLFVITNTKAALVHDAVLRCNVQISRSKCLLMISVKR